jgi:ketosteroid isomerase-like protein
MSNIETMQQIYEAFGRGDVPAILDRHADDVRWEHWPTGNAAQAADVPYMRARSGREEAAKFFQDIQDDFEMNEFNPHTFLEGNGHVAVVIEVDLTVRSTGKRVQDEEIHLVEFDSEGKVSSFRHLLDTAKAIDAHQ